MYIFEVRAIDEREKLSLHLSGQFKQSLTLSKIPEISLPRRVLSSNPVELPNLLMCQ